MVRTLPWHEVLTAASKNYPTRDYVTHPTNAMVHPSHLKRRAAEVAKPLASFLFCRKKAHKAQNQLTIIQVSYFCALCAFLRLIILRRYCLRM
jgi:hypothetical protein